jgi:hypothetical protein
VLDADLKRFEDEGINQTRAGLRLRMAVHESRIAAAQIRRLQEINDPRRLSRRVLESWRQSYIRANENASRAIDELWDAFQWPTDAARDRRYEYRAPKITR